MWPRAAQLRPARAPQQRMAPHAAASRRGRGPDGRRGRRQPTGSYRAGRDVPVGGQAVLEGVMMRGVYHWAVAVRKPDAKPIASDRRDRRARGDRGQNPLMSRAPPDPAAAGDPRRRRAVRLDGGRVPRTRDRGQRAARRRGGREEAAGALRRWAWIGTIVVALAFAVVLFFVVPVGGDEPDQGAAGSSVLFWLVEGIIRTAIFLGYLYAALPAETCGASSSTTAPSTRRSPA